ncbi:MAG: CDP-diacylglycerol--glycerol-3-phosphate 3-phosphatidyltransferase [Pseudanabaenaceae cyanobacterium]
MNFAVLNLPNWVSLSRLVAVPVIWVGIDHNYPELATVVFLIACATDWLDGYLARKLDMVTELGKVLDPLIDKLLVLAPLLALIELNIIPAWGVYLIMARELVVTAWRGNSQTGANFWGKAKTVIQMITIVALLLNWQYAVYLFWVTVVITIWSGITYFLPA